MALSIPIIAIINRKESPIGQAIARRLDSRNPHRAASEAVGLENETLRRRVAELEDKVQTLEIEMTFVNNLLEEPKPDRAGI
jgi:hypothetical protein